MSWYFYKSGQIRHLITFFHFIKNKEPVADRKPLKRRGIWELFCQSKRMVFPDLQDLRSNSLLETKDVLGHPDSKWLQLYESTNEYCLNKNKQIPEIKKKLFRIIFSLDIWINQIERFNINYLYKWIILGYQ